MKMEFKITHDDGRIVVTDIHGYKPLHDEMTPTKMQEEQDVWARRNFGPNIPNLVILGIGEELAELFTANDKGHILLCIIHSC